MRLIGSASSSRRRWWAQKRRASAGQRLVLIDAKPLEKKKAAVGALESSKSAQRFAFGGSAIAALNLSTTVGQLCVLQIALESSTQQGDFSTRRSPS